MSQPIRSQGGHLVFPIGPKNTGLEEDIKILLRVKFRWIPFSGFREEVENVSADHRPGRPSFFLTGPKNTNLVMDVEILHPVKFRWIPFSVFREEVENVKVYEQRTDWRTDDERSAMTIAHLSLRLRWAKSGLVVRFIWEIECFLLKLLVIFGYNLICQIHCTKIS